MTAAQKTAQANFKKAIAYRKKTGCSLKQAFAHVKGSKVTGLEKVVKKGNKTTVLYSKKTTTKKSAPKKKTTQGKLFGVKKISGVMPHKAKYYIEYKKNSIDTIEYFDKLPKDLYYAGGYNDIKDKGKAYVTRFTDYGTSLIPLKHTKNNTQVKK